MNNSPAAFKMGSERLPGVQISVKYPQNLPNPGSGMTKRQQPPLLFAAELLGKAIGLSHFLKER